MRDGELKNRIMRTGHVSAKELLEIITLENNRTTRQKEGLQNHTKEQESLQRQMHYSNNETMDGIRNSQGMPTQHREVTPQFHNKSPSGNALSAKQPRQQHHTTAKNQTTAGRPPIMRKCRTVTPMEAQRQGRATATLATTTKGPFTYYVSGQGGGVSQFQIFSDKGGGLAYF